MIKKILIGICVLVTIYVAYVLIVSSAMVKAQNQGLITINNK